MARPEIREHGPTVAQALLTISGLAASYGNKRVLEIVGLRVEHGEAIAPIDRNGAGKTTLLQTAFGLQRSWRGHMTLARQPISDRHSVRAAVALGMAMIPAERFVFPDLTVLDNLRLSARGLGVGERTERLHAAYDAFPI